MRKIVIAFDGTHYSDAALKFALRLNEKNPVMVTGAFMPQTDIASLWNYNGGSSSGPDLIPLVGDDSGEEINKNIRRFENYCAGHNIEYRVHKDYFDFAIPELKKETRFADLLILSSENFYANMGSEPNEYLKETLHEVECPVILVPDTFEFPAYNVLTYDGSESSVHAIKQFAYLLPELAGNETTLIYAKENVTGPLPDELNIEELIARHFPNAKLLRFGPNPRKYFLNWLIEKKASILVSGSFGRSGLSRLFHKSFVSEVMKEHRIPLFIAHK